MTASSRTKKIVAGANLALAFVAWFALAPRELGGSVSYVITHGVSMQPRVHEGDLVLVRKASFYERGDVIAYDSELLQRPVMHRIVAGGPTGYITKGDNNDWVDSDRPSDADVIGKEWLHIPKAGKVLGYAGTPVGAAALAGIGGVLVFAGHSMSRTRGRRRTTMPKIMPNIDTSRFAGLDVARRVGLAGVALGVLSSLLLGYLSLTADPVGISGGSAYTHAGQFTYSADVPKSRVYPDGTATTGEPLFLKLIDEIDFAFTYRLETAASADISGKAMLWLRVSDGSGWKGGFFLQPQTEFTGGEVTVGGSIDPKDIHDLIAEVQAATGVITNPVTVTLLPTISINGVIDGRAVDDRFQPNLPLTLDGLQMRLATQGASGSSDPAATPSDPLNPRLEKDAGGTRVSAAAVQLLGLEIPLRYARPGALLGLAASFGAGWWIWSRRKPTDDDEDMAIAARYSEWLIPVAPRATHVDSAIEVTSIDGLVRLAERYERMILNTANGTGHRYMVEDAGVLYFYETSRAVTQGKLFEPEPEPEPEPKPEPPLAATVAPPAPKTVAAPKKKVAAAPETEKKVAAEKKATSSRKMTVARKTSATRKTSTTARPKRPRSSS